MRQPLEVEIFGQQFTVVSDEGEEHVRQVADYVAQRMRQLADGSPTTILQLAVVTALNIASEYRKLQHQQQEMDQMINRMTQRLLSRIGR